MAVSQTHNPKASVLAVILQKSTFLQTELLRHFTDIHLQFPSKLSLPRSGLLVVKLDLVLITLRLPSPDEFTAEANKPESSPVQTKLKPT